MNVNFGAFAPSTSFPFIAFPLAQVKYRRRKKKYSSYALHCLPAVERVLYNISFTLLYVFFFFLNFILFFCGW